MKPRKKRKKTDHGGSTFDSFLEHEGRCREFESVVIKKPTRLLLPLVLALTCGFGRGGASRTRQIHYDARDAVPLPADMSPTAIFTTDSPLLVIKTARDAYRRSVYSWQPGKTPVRIIEGRDLDITRLSDNTFAAWFSDGHHEQFVTLDGEGVVSQPLVLPNGGPRGWEGCEGDSIHVVCIGDRPGMTEQDKDYDEMGFTAVLVVNLAARQANWFSVRDRAHFRFDEKRKMVYVVDRDSTSSHGRVEGFDLDGKDRGPAPLPDVLPSSPAGQYVESLAEDGSELWEVYDTATMATLLKFNCNQAGCREGDRDNAPWNPKFSGQLVAIRSDGAYGKGGACDIYQLSPPRVLKTVPCGGLPVYDWSRDGRDLVTLQYEGNIFRRESVN